MMDELIIRSLQGRSTQEEEERLRAWRSRSVDVDRRYREIEALWTLVGAAAPEADASLPDVAQLIATAEEEAPSSPQVEAPAVHAPYAPRTVTPPSRGRRTRGHGWMARAAVAAGLMATGIGIGALANRPEGPVLLSQSEVVTGAGEMTTMTLGDGTSIRLGPRSRIRLSEEEGRRLAWLEGRAYFGVQSDSARPFTVMTALGEAHVLGTRFEVRTEEEFRVLVVDGSVSVSAGGAELQLSAGEMSRSDPGQPPSAEQVDDVYAQLDWLGDALVFQSTPLDRALREIERRYGVDVLLEDSTLASQTVTATFTGRPVDQVIYVICEIVNANCTSDGGTVRIGRN